MTRPTDSRLNASTVPELKTHWQKANCPAKVSASVAPPCSLPAKGSTQVPNSPFPFPASTSPGQTSQSSPCPPPRFAESEAPNSKRHETSDGYFQFLAKLNHDLSISTDRSHAVLQFLTRVTQLLKVDVAALVGDFPHPVSNSLPWRRPHVLGISGSSTVDQSSSLVATLEIAARMSLDVASAPETPFTDSETASKDSVDSSCFAGSLLDAARQSLDTPAESGLVPDWLQKVATELGSPVAKTIRIDQRKGPPFVLILAGSKETLDAQQASVLDDALPLVVGPFLENLGKVHQSAMGRLASLPLGLVQKNWKMTSLILAGLVALAAFPMAYTLNCDCKLETANRRFAVAPYQGKLDKVLVSPGMRVSEGQTLAVMDGKELRLKAAALKAEHAKELQEAQAALADNQSAQAKIFKHKAKRIEQELKLIDHQLANLEVKSAISGTVVQGDIQQLIGAPVEIGQNLLEIAPLETLIVQIGVPEYQLRYVREGLPVRLSIEAYPFETWEATVLRIQPRATIQNHTNVFIAEVKVANKDFRLQPGMKGRAKIVSDTYPLAWNWLHYPYERMRTLAGWF